MIGYRYCILPGRRDAPVLADFLERTRVLQPYGQFQFLFEVDELGQQLSDALIAFAAFLAECLADYPFQVGGDLRNNL